MCKSPTHEYNTVQIILFDEKNISIYRFYLPIKTVMESVHDDYEDYLQMLQEEKDGELVDELLSENYGGDSDPEYVPNNDDLSDDEMEITPDGRKRKGSNSSQILAKRLCLNSEDSFASTSTSEGLVNMERDDFPTNPSDNDQG